VERLNAFAVGPHLPGLTLVLEVRPDIAKARLATRAGKEMDRMETEPDDFYERVREGYRKVARDHPHRVKVVSADGTREETASALWREVATAYKF
jgi:dTMP kinase